MNQFHVNRCSLGLAFRHLILIAWACVALPGLLRGTHGVSAAEPTASLDFAAARAILQAACADCHAGDKPEANFSLDSVALETSLRGEFHRWQQIQQRITDRSMPPADAEPLDPEQRTALSVWIRTASLQAVAPHGPVAGPPLFRRLARHEYANSIRDLLDVHFDAGQGLPEDAAGGEGFANASETLVIAPIHAEKYVEAATDALAYAARDSRARRRLLATLPSDAVPERDAARANLRVLADRAFRRPVPDAEVEPFVEQFLAARRDELPFEEAVLYAMRGILVSPRFLFLAEAAPAQPNVAEPLSDHELAARLSYFLWASTPDDALREAADAGRLRDEQVLREQTIRLLTARGTHLQDSLETFVGSWLGTADLGRAKQFDPERHVWLEDPHIDGLRNQPIYALESILKQNESVLLLIDAPWTFLNNELVRVYRIRKEKIKEEFVQQLVRVNLPEEYQYRGGLLGMGGILAVSSYPRRSSPVLRGAWVLEKLLGVELPPPPPNVPALDESPEIVQAKTLRERLVRHRADAACATCHDRIDPIGFALENFDEIGRWRDKDEGGPIDPVAHLPGGVEVKGIAGLKQYLLDRKDIFVRVLTRKMLGYALGRSLQTTDLVTVESIAQRLEQNDYRSQELILGIVMSEPFRKKLIRAESDR